MNNLILGLLAETFIHSGIGRNEGAIDLPVARESATDYPYIPGSSLKGALRDHARGYWKNNGEAGKVETCFGREGAEQAGDVLISDARLLLLPVRSLTGAYKWVTSPLLLERLRRDMERSGTDLDIESVTAPPDGKYLGKTEGILYLEERTFSHHGGVADGLIGAIGGFMAHDSASSRLADQLVILNDGDFSWFARYALSVQARNVLEPGTKRSKNLWYEESLPPDTLMYAVLGERRESGALSDLQELIGRHPYLQTGGNETVGMGWFVLKQVGGKDGKAESGEGEQ